MRTGQEDLVSSVRWPSSLEGWGLGITRVLQRGGDTVGVLRWGLQNEVTLGMWHMTPGSRVKGSLVTVVSLEL